MRVENERQKALDEVASKASSLSQQQENVGTNTDRTSDKFTKEGDIAFDDGSDHLLLQVVTVGEYSNLGQGNFGKLPDCPDPVVEADIRTRRELQKFLMWRGSRNQALGCSLSLESEKIINLTMPVNSDLETVFGAGASRLAFEYFGPDLASPLSNHDMEVNTDQIVLEPDFYKDKKTKRRDCSQLEGGLDGDEESEAKRLRMEVVDSNIGEGGQDKKVVFPLGSDLEPICQEDEDGSGGGGQVKRGGVVLGNDDIQDRTVVGDIVGGEGNSNPKKKRSNRLEKIGRNQKKKKFTQDIKDMLEVSNGFEDMSDLEVSMYLEQFRKG